MSPKQSFYLSGWDRWGPKTFKTNEVVWDAKMIAMKPEKMFWTAEIELYRWVMSNGPYGYKKNLKMVSMFLDFGAEISTRYCWQVILWCFHVRGGSESCNFGPKNEFLVIFLAKNIFFGFLSFLFLIFFLYFSPQSFFEFWFFWHLQISLKKWFFDDDFLCFWSILVPKSSPSPLYNLLG